MGLNKRIDRSTRTIHEYLWFMVRLRLLSHAGCHKCSNAVYGYTQAVWILYHAKLEEKVKAFQDMERLNLTWLLYPKFMG